MCIFRCFEFVDLFFANFETLAEDEIWSLQGSTHLCRAGVDSPTSPTLAGPYFRGALIKWAWHHRTKSDQIGWSVQLLSHGGWKGKIENTF